MAHGGDEERCGRRNDALAAAHRALADVQEHLHGQRPDVGAALGSLTADCQALLDDLAPDAADAGVPPARARRGEGPL